MARSLTNCGKYSPDNCDLGKFWRAVPRNFEGKSTIDNRKQTYHVERKSDSQIAVELHKANPPHPLRNPAADHTSNCPLCNFFEPYILLTFMYGLLLIQLDIQIVPVAV